MNETDTNFTEEYSPDSGTEKGIKIKFTPASTYSYEEPEKRGAYKSGKPYRSIIRAKITRD